MVWSNKNNISSPTRLKTITIYINMFSNDRLLTINHNIYKATRNVECYDVIGRLGKGLGSVQYTRHTKFLLSRITRINKIALFQETCL